MPRILVGILLAGALVNYARGGDAAPLCAGGTWLGTTRLEIAPFSPGPPLAIKSVAEIRGGSHLIWNPARFFPRPPHDAEVAAVLVPSSGDDSIIVLEPRNATMSTEWQLPERPQVIALIYGPQGLSEGKIKSLVAHNRELLMQLADYAAESSLVEALVQDLSNAEQSGAGTGAVVKGISSKYGVTSQKLNSTPSNQQASLLLSAVLPTAIAFDPLGSSTSQAQQSGGLAASVAGLFFGNPVALAAGGAALFANLKTVLFPDTEFRSAFTQAADDGGLALCTKNPAAKAKTRIAYLWAYRSPEIKKPEVTIKGTSNFPLGAKAVLAVKLSGGASTKDLELARDWRLAPVSGGSPVPVAVQATAAGALELDPSNLKTPGDYQLSATWDWDALPVAGTLHIRSYGDLAHAAFPPEERDKLIAGNGGGEVTAALSGADFEFLDRVQIQSAARGAKPVDVGFRLPVGKRAGPQQSVALDLDTTKSGAYHLLLSQSDGVVQQIPVTILPPKPKLANLPIHVNEGEARQKIHLEGSGLDRVDAVSSDAGEITGAADAGGWTGEIALKDGISKGRRFSLLLTVRGLSAPIAVPDAIVVEGPRPAISGLRKSQAADLGVVLGEDELPIGMAAGLVLSVDHLDAGAQPALELHCHGGDLRHALTLAPGEPSHGAILTFPGPGVLYLSFDPGVVGYPGCRLEATVVLDPEGRSDPYALGRAVRLPHLDRFNLSAEKAGDSSYAGTIQGSDLDVIDKVGWDAEDGVPVGAIATPIPGDPARQTLRVVLPWPAPAPHAPLYVWLRGESMGRKTNVTY